MTPDPVTTALSAFRERALASRPDITYCTVCGAEYDHRRESRPGGACMGRASAPRPSEETVGAVTGALDERMREPWRIADLARAALGAALERKEETNG